jgi:hypothetical protein
LADTVGGDWNVWLISGTVAIGDSIKLMGARQVELLAQAHDMIQHGGNWDYRFDPFATGSTIIISELDR